jgi:hypothetical protein
MGRVVIMATCDAQSSECQAHETSGLTSGLHDLHLGPEDLLCNLELHLAE